MKMYTYDEVLLAALLYFNNDNLAATTWINKYARRDKDGNLLDLTPDDMHKRMAKAFAEIEEKYRHKLNPDDNLKLSEYGYSREELTEEKIYNLFKNFKYVIPAGSVMSGIGNFAPVSLSNCFIAGTKVLTKTGLKNIENIQIGEYVLSDDGEYHKVVNTLSRDYSGDLYKFESTEIYEPIICTPNHKFLTNHGWKRADRILAPVSKQIHSVDKLKIAYTENNIFAHNGEGTIIDLTEGYIPSENLVLLENGNKISLDLHFIGGNNAHSHKLTFELNKTFEFDSDFAYFVGRWLGDGSITRRKGKRNHEILQIVFNATTEKDAFERCKEIGERKFGLKANVCITKQNVIALRFNSELIGSWFYREFGEKCDGKHIPDKYNGNLNMLLGLCDSDGCIYGHGGFKLFLKNDNLISWARLTMYLNNINASAIHQRKNEGYYSVGFEVTVNQATSKLNKYLTKQYADNRREEYIRDITNDYAQIQSVEILENLNVKVYNLSVEDTHTYNVNGVFCHNCWVINGPGDSLEEIFRVCNELSQLMKRRGGVGFDISNLRPSGATVNNSAKSSTGAASFMDLFSHVTNTIALNGRRGALMLSIHIQHPDSQLFIEKKQDLSKVTGANVSVLIDDEFMECVKADKDYFQVWPINAAVNDELTHRGNKLNSYDEYEYDKMYPMVYTDKSKMSSIVKQGYIKKIKAKELWNKLIHCAWNTAEPGIIFQTKHHNYSPDGVYPSFRGTCTNPCVTGDTMVAVADGRGYVSIKELAESGDDVPVYCLNDKAKLTISNMVHPRISGYDQDIYEVELENGHKIKCTGNHKFLTNDKGYVETTSLVPGDSLMIMTKSQMNWDERYHKKPGKHLPYNFMFISGSNQAIPEHLMIYKHFYPNDKTFEVVHHIDYNGLNNDPSNLRGMTAKDHVAFHKQNMYGKNNPMYKISNDPERKALYGKVMSEAVSGEKNGRCKIKLDKYYKDAVKFAKKLNRNFYLKEWLDQCKDLNYPIIWDNFLQRSFGTSSEFIKKVAEDAGVEYIVSNGKLMEKYLRAKLNGYNVFVSKDEKDILIEKVCEVCGKPFITKWDTREYAYCSKECVYKAVGNKHKSLYIDKNKKLIEIYKTTNINDFALLRKEFKLKTNKVYDVRAKLAFKNIDEVKEAVTMYNHKVVSIKYVGKDTVYNGTVEKYHNYFTGKFEEENQFGRLNILSINQLNCGEIYMNEDSCRLIHINLTSFVKEGKLDEDSLYKTTYETMRLADDLVDLEEDAIKQILKKIEDDGDKGNSEYNLYERLLAHSLEGRRCGLGFTGLADTIALLGYKYDSDEALDMINHIMRLMFIAEMDSEIDMAITRGKFPAYNQSYEKKGNLWYDTLKKDMPLLYEKMMKFGRRNISQNTVAPTGCCHEDEIIKMYNMSDITFKDLFNLNNIDIEYLKENNIKHTWFELTDNYYVKGINNEKNKITKLYWRGATDGKIIKLSNGQIIKCSPEHKFLVKKGDIIEWIKACELSNNDKILKIKIKN